MKTLLVLLTIVSITLCGHIYVEDPMLKWQNKDKFGTVTLRFNLESGIEKHNYLRIVWPFDWNWSSCVLVGDKAQKGKCSVGAATIGS